MNLSNLVPPNRCDGYKTGHPYQYPENTTLVMSNLTARGTRIEGLTKVVWFGLQYFVKRYLIEDWRDNFFSKPWEEVGSKYQRRLSSYLGQEVRDDKVKALHELGYLPIRILALPEGSRVNLRVPMMVVHSTHDDFAWVTNSIETILSTSIWLPCTSATTAHMYREKLDNWAKKTNSEMMEFVPFQGHDFSFRGHGSCESAITSAAAHLLSFAGTDTIPAIDFFEEYYNADCEKEMIGMSVPATEHAVQCVGGQDNEVETFRRLIEDVYPNGIVSIVSDTWDFWKVIDPKSGFLVQLKDKIMARDGKVVIRPDSGDPVEIVCGVEVQDYTERCETIDELIRFVQDFAINQAHDETPHGEHGPSEVQILARISNTVYEVTVNIEWNRHDKQYYYIDGSSVSYKEVELTVPQKGLVQCLWEIFGGTISKEGFKQLDSHIGAIYGDSITLSRCEAICQRLADKGFASTNLVYGIGSFTYQGAISPDAIVTRDTHGFAVKATYAELKNPDGTTEAREIFKDPVTDDGLKKSARGITAVYRDDDGQFSLKDQATWEDLNSCDLEEVFCNSNLKRDQSLAEIRDVLQKS